MVTLVLSVDALAVNIVLERGTAATISVVLVTWAVILATRGMIVHRVGTIIMF